MKKFELVEDEVEVRPVDPVEKFTQQLEVILNSDDSLLRPGDYQPLVYQYNEVRSTYLTLTRGKYSAIYYHGAFCQDIVNHDIFTLAQIQQSGLDPEFISLIELCTKMDGESSDAHFARKMLSDNPAIIAICLADAICNVLRYHDLKDIPTRDKHIARQQLAMQRYVDLA